MDLQARFYSMIHGVLIATSLTQDEREYIMQLLHDELQVELLTRAALGDEEE